ncbi:MAG: hypothetical protein ABR968_11745 [Bacteroidales bacterium]|jgi:hypothetical protein
MKKISVSINALAQKISKTNSIIISALLFLLASCNPYINKIYEGQYTFDISPNNEVIINESLKTFLAQNKSPKFVLRTPETKSVTEEEKTANELYYTTIEKTLMKHGYTVRDRSLLNELVHQGQSYEQIAKSIDTDLILEIQGIKNYKSDIYNYTIPSKNFSGNLANAYYIIPGQKTNRGGGCGPGASTPATFQRLGPISRNYTQIEIKIVLIKSGEFGGYMKLNYDGYGSWVSFFLAMSEKKKTGEITEKSCKKIGWDKNDVNYNSLDFNYYITNDQGKEKVFEGLTMMMLNKMGMGN